MQDKLEKLIKVVYGKWKAARTDSGAQHPGEEVLASFLEAKLSQRETEGIKEHLLICDSCMEQVATQLKIGKVEDKDLPQELIQKVKDLVLSKEQSSILEIFLRLKERALEILSTTGDVLVGQELVPAPLLRSRKIKDFPDEINILKDFKDIRVEVKIESKPGQLFSLSVMIKEKATQRIMKDLRVTLIKDGLELESYLADSGRATFEHVLLGKYTLEISTLENKIASILLDIKV